MSTLKNLKPIMHPYNRAVNRDQAIDVFHAPLTFTSSSNSVEVAFADTIPSGYMALVEFYGVGKGAAGARIGFRAMATIENNSGTMALVGTPIYEIMEDNASANQTDVTITVSGANFQLSVDRVDGDTTVWRFGYNILVS